MKWSIVSIVTSVTHKVMAEKRKNYDLNLSWALLDARKKLATEKLAESFLSMKNVDNVEDLTDKIFEEGEIEISML